MHHGLLVAREVEAQAIAALLQGLADAGHVAVAEDAEHAGHEAPLHAVALAVLAGQELHDRLRGGETSRLHRHLPVALVMGTRGSGTREDQLSRIQWCVGSSQKAIERCSAGPASTFRKYRSWSGLAASGP